MSAIGDAQIGMDRSANSMGRAFITATDDTQMWQQVTHQGHQGEQADGIELVHPYGFTSNVQPPTGTQGAEAIVAYPTGDRSHGVIIAHGDRRFRLTGLANGEVAIHDDQGQKVHLTRSGIVVNTPGTLTITAGGAVTITAPTINLAGKCNLGTGGPMVPAAKQGTIDTGGNADVENLASSVNVV